MVTYLPSCMFTYMPLNAQAISVCLYDRTSVLLGCTLLTKDELKTFSKCAAILKIWGGGEINP